MRRRLPLSCGPLGGTLALAMLTAVVGVCVPAHGAERVTLRTGFEFDCARREAVGDRVRLYLLPGAGAASSDASANYIEVDASAVLRVEKLPDAAAVPVAAGVPAAVASTGAGGVRASGAAAAAAATGPTPVAVGAMLARAGAEHNIDVDLLASVVAAESGGNARAVSSAGAEGLMQLMPGTASDLGVRDRFAPEENIGGGTAYLDALLTRYHDNIALAVAAYNAGPAAVDRYHGIPPYAETRAYVARVIREFNRRKRAARTAQRSLMAAAR